MDGITTVGHLTLHCSVLVKSADIVCSEKRSVGWSNELGSSLPKYVGIIIRLFICFLLFSVDLFGVKKAVRFVSSLWFCACFV